MISSADVERALVNLRDISHDKTSYSKGLDDLVARFRHTRAEVLQVLNELAPLLKLLDAARNAVGTRQLPPNPEIDAAIDRLGHTERFLRRGPEGAAFVAKVEGMCAADEAWRDHQRQKLSLQQVAQDVRRRLMNLSG